MEFLKMLFASRNVKSSGNKAIEEVIASFEEIIDDLSGAIVETDNERIEAEYTLAAATADKERIEEIMVKGENLLKGLRVLLQG